MRERKHLVLPWYPRMMASHCQSCSGSYATARPSSCLKTGTGTMHACIFFFFPSFSSTPLASRSSGSSPTVFICATDSLMIHSEAFLLVFHSHPYVCVLLRHCPYHILDPLGMCQGEEQRERTNAIVCFSCTTCLSDAPESTHAWLPLAFPLPQGPRTLHQPLPYRSPVNLSYKFQLLP